MLYKILFEYYSGIEIILPLNDVELNDDVNIQYFYKKFKRKTKLSTYATKI